MLLIPVIMNLAKILTHPPDAIKTNINILPSFYCTHLQKANKPRSTIKRVSLGEKTRLIGTAEVKPGD